MRVLVNWLTVDGEEHEEQWPSLDAFLSWAAAEGLRASWRAYEEDEDGDFVLFDKGQVG